MAVGRITVMNAPEELPLPARAAAGPLPGGCAPRRRDHRWRSALAAIFVLAALGAHFGVYHLATSSHSTGRDGTPYVGLDATQRAVVQPVLGFLQVLALVLAVATVVLLVVRWRRASTGTAIAFASMLGGWLLVAGLTQGVPAAVYQATSVSPNEQTAQTPTINDLPDHEPLRMGAREHRVEPAGGGHRPSARRMRRRSATSSPTSARCRTCGSRTRRSCRTPSRRSIARRSYQTYSTITVDRYPDATTGSRRRGDDRTARDRRG